MNYWPSRPLEQGLFSFFFANHIAPPLHVSFLSPWVFFFLSLLEQLLREIKASISFSILKGSRQMPTCMTGVLLQTGRAACLPSTPCNTACKRSSPTPESTSGTSSQGFISRSHPAHEHTAAACQATVTVLQTKGQALLSERYRMVRRGRDAQAHLTTHHMEAAARIRQEH